MGSLAVSGYSYSFSLISWSGPNLTVSYADLSMGLEFFIWTPLTPSNMVKAKSLITFFIIIRYNKFKINLYKKKYI